ncbi:MAG: T9SS type A sorting domain-containing protein [Prevotellaceae bacterium]|nr:T9SS type A sorting domain-containing protein [Prevotellaceae bacterium]
MKKIIMSSFGLLAAVSGMAQPTLTYAKHGLRVGDVHQTRRVTTAEPGASGANVTWDFSACKVTGDVQSEALERSGEHIAVRNDGNVLFQFDATPYGNDYYGYAASGYSVVYENPALKTRYPFGFLDQHSGEFQGYIAQGNSKTTVEGTYSSEVDGYGTLKLPNGVTLSNVLRVKTTEVQKRLYGSVVSSAEVKYLWYSQDFRYPVFVTIEHGSDLKEAKDANRSSYVNVAALSAPAVAVSNTGNKQQAASVNLPEITYDIYPNPVKDAAAITYKLPYDAKVSVAVYTITSACVRKIVNNEFQTAGEYAYTYTPATPGTYFVRFAFGDKAYIEQIVKK